MGLFPAFDILKEASVNWPEKPAVYDDYGRLSFGQLYAEAEELRLKLKGLGIKQGMAVGLKACNGRNFITGLFAVVGCGATVMPVYHQLKKPEIDTILQETRLHALLDDKSGPAYFDRSDAVIPMKAGQFHFHLIEANQGLVFAPHVKMPAFMRFTSGTTGKSKGVVISHQSAIERIAAANKGLALGSGDIVIWVLPMAYHFLVSIVLYIKYGVAIAIAKDFLAKNIIQLTNQYSGTLLYASPLQIRLLANDAGTAEMPSLKRIISTSAGVSADVCLAFKKRFNKDVSQAYGIIEIGLPMINTIQSADHPDAVGYALPDFDIAILDDHNNPLPPGTIGHLGIKGPGMFDAYLLPAQVRDEVLINGYFLTADYASKAADGLVKIEGRAKSVINLSGIKIFPEEIESVLETIPEIRLARVSSKPHNLLGQIIEAEVVLEEGATIDIATVLTFCRQRLSNLKAPRRVTIVSTLPITNTGKLRRD
ncbi:MAG: AMP-binding protein [Bacteroidota bacterium]|nr:AMP-binding protein [Bacteroidota bacterium]